MKNFYGLMIMYAFIGLYAASNYRYWVYRSGNEYLQNLKNVEGYFVKHTNWYDEFMKYINQSILESSLILTVVGSGIMFIKKINDMDITGFYLQRMKTSGLLQILVILSIGIIIRLITARFRNNRIIRQDNLNKFLTIHVLLMSIPFLVVDSNIAFLILAIVAGKIIWFDFNIENENIAQTCKMLYYIIFKNTVKCGPEDYFIYNSGRMLFRLGLFFFVAVFVLKFINRF